MNRFNLIFLIIFLTFILPGPPNTAINSDEEFNKLIKFKSDLYYAYNHLQNVTFTHSFGNLTGFKLSYQDALDGEVNQTYPLPGKDYNHWENNQNYSILPDEISGSAQRIWSLEPSSTDNANKINTINNNIVQASSNYYTNISSTLRGDFSLVQHETRNFTKLPLKIPGYLVDYEDDDESNGRNSGRRNDVDGGDSNDFDEDKTIGNVTYDTGLIAAEISVVDHLNKMHFNVLDSKIKLVNIDFTISNTNEEKKQTLETKGFYFVETGNLITSTNSAKFLSFYGGLQHLTFDEESFELSKNISIEYLQRTFFKQSNLRNNYELNFNLMSQFIDKAKNHCEFISYFHLNKVNLTKNEIKNIDDELNYPIGRPINFNGIPDLNMTGFLYSPDCSLELNVPHIIGVKREIHLYKMHKVVILQILLLLSQIFLVIKQMNQTNTPSTISRISFWTICMMSLVDGALSMLFLLGSAILDKLYLPLTVGAFLSFILASIFEMRYMISIFTSQLNERTINIFTALQGRPLDDDNNNNEEGTPVTTTTTTALPSPEPQDESQVSGAIYTRFFITLFLFTFLVLNSVMWSRTSRRNFEYAVITILSSYWLPQVYRNVIRGSHRSFRWWFILGTTFFRLVPIFYVFVDKSNVFHHHYDGKFFVMIVVWLAFQLLLLLLQELFGARFFLPKKLLPQTYNYHPILTETDLESGFGIEHVDDVHSSSDPATTIKSMENGHCTIDCAICMNEVELPIMKSNFDQPANFILRRNYMVTPCRHIFHTQCLEAWMKYKLQCPVCRSSLPPL